MKLKYIFLSAIILLSLNSCNKKEDNYQAKNIQVESVFDKKEDQKKAEKSNEDIKAEEKTEVKKQKPAKEENKKKKFRTRDTTNMRSEPNTVEDNILVAVPGGSEFEALEETKGEDSNWIKLTFEGNTGFIRKDMLEEIK